MGEFCMARDPLLGEVQYRTFEHYYHANAECFVSRLKFVGCVFCVVS